MDAWTGISGTNYTSRRPRGLAPWKPQGRLAVVLADVIEQLDAEIDYWPLTARHEGYRLIEHAGYDKTDATFDDAERVILRGRRAGLIPWEAIDDGRSETDEVPTWGTVAEFLDDVPDWFRLDLLADQDAIEVLVEAAGMVAQAAAVAHRYTVPVVTSSGTRTTSVIHELAERTVERATEDGRKTIVLLIGDLDVDGISAMDSTVDDARAFVTDMTNETFAEMFLHFEIVALTREQVERYGITTKPGGKLVRRGDYDGPAVQLEALEAADFAAILDEAIAEFVDPERFDARASLRDELRDEVRSRLDGHR